MLKMFTWLKDAMKKRDPEYVYLSNSADLVDLEHRLKMIERGRAPFQFGTHRLYGSF